MKMIGHTIARTVLLPLAFFAAQIAHGECVAPTSPIFPPGATATMEDMETAQTAQENYVVVAEEYLACLEEEEQTAISSGVESNESKIARDNSYQLAVDNMKEVSAELLLQFDEFESSQ